jgi:hypothetical protein
VLERSLPASRTCFLLGQAKAMQDFQPEVPPLRSFHISNVVDILYVSKCFT